MGGRDLAVYYRQYADAAMAKEGEAIEVAAEKFLVVAKQNHVLN